MGYFYIKRGLAVKGGSVLIGADCNLIRDAADRLATDDAFRVGGTANLQGATRIGGAATLAANLTHSAGTAAFQGTALVLPYHTVSPDVNNNGQFAVLQKGNRSYLLYQAGGTPCYITLPQVTAGTMLVTVGGTP